MTIRVARPDDAGAVHAIYAPLVASTTISFELAPPSVEEMRGRIEATLAHLPWLVSEGADGGIEGYAYASRHRERAAYRWSVDVSAYVRDDRRGKGIGKTLYTALLAQLGELGYHQAFAGIALPNVASVALHEAVGFAALGVFRDAGYKLGAWHDVGWWQRRLRPLGASGDPPGEPRPFNHVV